MEMQTDTREKLQMYDSTQLKIFLIKVRFSWSLTFLHHTCSNSELGGVVGSSMAFSLPGLLLGYNQLFPLLDGQMSFDILDLHLRLRYSLKNRHIYLTD